MAPDHEATLHPSPTNEYTRDLRAFSPTYEFRLLQTRLTIHALALSGTSTIDQSNLLDIMLLRNDVDDMH